MGTRTSRLHLMGRGRDDGDNPYPRVCCTAGGGIVVRASDARAAGIDRACRELFTRRGLPGEPYQSGDREHVGAPDWRRLPGWTCCTEVFAGLVVAAGGSTPGEAVRGPAARKNMKTVETVRNR